MEAPGIEPGSRGTSAPASTCVARRCLEPARGRLPVRFPELRRAGFPDRYRPGFLTEAAAESKRVLVRAPQASAIPNWRPNRGLSGEARGTAHGLLRREVELRFSS